jgi:hypothetical protein
MPEKQPPNPLMVGAAELFFTLQKFKEGQEVTVVLWFMKMEE